MLDEAGGGSQPSDTVTFAVMANSTNILVLFNVSPPTQPQFAYGHTPETGDLQLIPLSPALTQLLSNNPLVDAVERGTILVAFQSDVESLPEPSPLILAGIATLAGLRLWARGRIGGGRRA